MRKEKTLFIIGIWVAVLPFLGFPSGARTFLFFLTGLALIYLSYLFYQQEKLRRPKSKEGDESFVDNISNGE